MVTLADTQVPEELTYTLASELAERCPLNNVVVGRFLWLTPSWIPILGNIHVLFIERKGTLTVEETTVGWLFRHKGFKGGKLFVAAAIWDRQLSPNLENHFLKIWYKP